MTNAVIDTAALAKLKDMIGGDTEDLSELVSDFLASFPGQAAKMQDQATTEDWAGLRITAHSCKSNARDLGATALSVLCAELERQCKAGQPDAPFEQVSAITAAGHTALDELRAVDLANV